MSRVAGLILAASAVLVSTSAFAVDRTPRGNVRVTVDACRAPRAEAVRYKEQICQKGAGGYTACRWVERVHTVETAGDCEPVDTVERTRPAERGVFPSYARVPSRG